MDKLLFSKESLKDFKVNPFTLMSQDWFLLTSGNKDDYNTMTASWGLSGYLWNKNIITTYIRPQRHTYEIAKKNDIFTLSFLEENQRDVLRFCGRTTGKKIDKVKETGLTPIELDGGIAFEQAKMIFICKKIYEQDISVNSFLDLDIVKKNYPNHDYHTSFVGEIISLYKKIK